MPGGFNKSSRKRLAEAAKRTEQLPLAMPQQPGWANVRPPVNIQTLRVTDDTPTGTVNGIDYYPAVPETWIPDPDGDFDDMFASATVVVFDKDNPGFAADDLIDAREVASVTISSVLWPTFKAMAAGSGGTKIEFAKVTGLFYQDTGGSPSPLCYFPATKQDCAALTGYTDRTAGEIYIANPYGYTITLPDSTIEYVMGVGGYYMCKDLGFSYAPGNDGPGGTGAGSRRVWGTTQYRSGIAIQCIAGVYTLYKGL